MEQSGNKKASSTIFSIGGQAKNDRSVKKTYFYNYQGNKWTPGPLLNIGRTMLSCGILRWKHPETNEFENIVVAAGGFDFKKNTYLSYVDLLHLDMNGDCGKWELGPELPGPAYGSTMTDFKSTVVLIGDFFENRFLYQLSSPDGPWIKMKQMLKKSRFRHVSFFVPNKLVNCYK